jgi:purine-binding chemotaxis protein CheW
MGDNDALDRGEESRTTEDQAKNGSLRSGRSANVESVLESGTDQDEALQEIKRVLRQRAKALSRRTDSTDADQQGVQVVELLLDQERYGIGVEYVRDVHPLKELTPMPCTPAFVKGIISIRGQILSVIDMREFFGLPRKGITDLSKVVIVRDDNTEFGILGDAVLGVRWIPLSEMQKELPTITGIRQEYLMGITADRLVVMNMGKLLADDRIIVNEKVEG